MPVITMVLTLSLVAPAETPNDPTYAQQHFELINAEAAWDITTGSGERIGVVDSGLVRTHDDFEGVDEGGWNFIDDDAAYDETSTDELAHGSHVAGTIAAKSNNGLGIAGLNWDARVISARALTSDGTQGNNVTITGAIRWLAGLDNTGFDAPSIAPVQVINLSVGFGGGCDDVTRDAVAEAIENGVVIVAASGNHGAPFPNDDDTVLAPASCPGVISVGAHDRSFNRTSYTNATGRVDMLAPGGLQTDGIPSYGTTENASDSFQFGTSMAAPHVAGVVSLMLSVNPQLSPAQVTSILTSLPLQGNADKPVLDALAAVQAAQSTEGEQPPPSGCACASSSPVDAAWWALCALCLGAARRVKCRARASSTMRRKNFAAM